MGWGGGGGVGVSAHYGSGMFKGWGAAAEVKAIREHQLEQRLVTTRDTIAQGCWCIRVGDYAGMVKEARSLKHIYLCPHSELHCALY